MAWRKQNQLEVEALVNTMKSQQLLPDQLSGKILDLEFQCQSTQISQEVIFRLMKLYTRAIQYYEERGNPKYRLYKQRMKNFLKQPQIELTLIGRPAELAVKKEQKAEQIRRAEISSQKQADCLLKQFYQEQGKQKAKINTSLRKQEEHLEKRMQTKRSLKNRSIRTEDADQPEGQTKERETMNMKLLLAGISQRKNLHKKVYL